MNKICFLSFFTFETRMRKNKNIFGDQTHRAKISKIDQKSYNAPNYLYCRKIYDIYEKYSEP